MTSLKRDYESPTVDVLELRVEGVICQSLNGNEITPGTLDDWGTLDLL